MGTFGVGAGIGLGNPLTGIAAVVAKKIIETPFVRLKVAKYIDKLSDARKAKIAKELQSGKVPEEIQNIVNQADLEPKNISPRKKINKQITNQKK